MKKKDWEKEKFELAPQIDIESYHDVAKRFFKEIFDMNYPEDILITDESSMFDFFFMDTWEKDLQEALNKIKNVFGLELNKEEDLFLVDIFKRIEHLA